jgi:hypothetical protein
MFGDGAVKFLSNVDKSKWAMFQWIGSYVAAT